MTIPRLLLAVLLLTVSISCKKQEEEKSTLSPKALAWQELLNTEANAFLQDTLLTSVSIGIYKDGEKITAHYGELDSGKANKPTDETIYEIASVSKTFAGALVAQAELEGKLSIEDDIRKYLNDAYPNLEFEGNPIKIKHLLLHQGGFPQFLPTSIGALMTEFNEDLPFKIHEIEKAYTKEQFLTDLHDIELTAIPGSQYGYSNVDVELMAHILENIYQQPYDEILKNKITSLAKMPSTGIRIDSSEQEKLANGYGMNRRLTPHFANKLWGAGGGMKSSMLDMTNYMEFLLAANNPMIVKSQEILLDLGDYGAGYFWPIRVNTEDGTYYNHHGGAYGTQNWLCIYPKYNLGISVITNQSDLETASKLQTLVNDILQSIKTNDLLN